MKLGFIGTGNMAGAIMGGIIQKQIFRPEEIIGSDISEKGRERVREQYGIAVTAENREVAEKAEILILSVKPQFYPEVIAEIRECIKPEQLIITIAPGKTLEWLQEQFGRRMKLVRTMPNTPAMVGEGMTGLCWSEDVFSDTERQELMQFFTSFGKTETVPENLMDAVTAASGSSPAFIYMMIEALADGVVKYGMPRDKAYTFVAQAVLGSAKMVLETGEHPGVLKDKVCSPGGTTIAAVAALEASGFRSSLIEAVSAVCDRCRNM